jgi:biopolymer transport protein ExbB/TolQ
MGWGVLLAAAIALGTAIYQYVKKLKEASELEKMMTDIRKRGAEGIVEEKMRLDALLEVARDETRSLDERKRAIDKLNAIIPDYNGQLDTTTGKYKENKEALDKYIDSLIRRYEIEGAKDKLKEIGKQKAQLAIDRQAAQQEVDKLKESKSTSLSSKGQQTQVKASGRSQMDADLGFVYSTANTTWNNNIKNAEAKVAAIDKKIEEQEKKIQLIKTPMVLNLQIT